MNLLQLPERKGDMTMYGFYFTKMGGCRTKDTREENTAYKPVKMSPVFPNPLVFIGLF